MLFLKVISKLAPSVIYSISDIAAFILFHIVRYRRTISYQNISRSFPNKSKSEILEIQRNAYRYLTDTFLEICKEYSQTQEDLASRVTFENFSEIKKAIDNNQKLIFLTGHTGPIEWIGHAASVYLGIPIDPVYKPSHNKAIDRFIFAIRSRYQATPIPYKTLAKDIILRKNVTRCIAILADLEPRSRDQAVEIDFLSQKTRFFLGPERMAKISNMPVYFVAIKNTKRGKYSATAHLISMNPKELEPEVLTRKFAMCMEELIIENPAAWLWTHRRWKNKRTKA